MTDRNVVTGVSVCTACGEFYRYQGNLHCPPGAPVTVRSTLDIEALAEVLANTHYGSAVWGYLTQEERVGYRAMARAAVEAMTDD